MKKYFYDLNYTLANEDTSVEYRLVEYFKPEHIFSICGSAGRVTPLCAFHPKKVTVADISQSQLLLLKLKIATIIQLEYGDYLKFWGFAPYSVDKNHELRQKIFSGLKLDAATKAFFLEVFKKHEWKGILYIGKWEQTFKKLNVFCQKVLGRATEDLFAFSDMEAQREYLKKKFPWLKWRFVLFVLGNKSIFNALLYKGDFVKKNIPGSHYSYYNRAFSHLMTHGLTRRSFFLQLCFLGEIRFAEGNTVDAHREVFHQMKNSLGSLDIDFKVTDLLSSFENIPENARYDFASLSDVPSYFSGDIERDYLQVVRRGMRDGGIVVVRSYLRIPEANLDGYQDITHDFSYLIDDETVQMYHFQILKAC